MAAYLLTEMQASRTDARFSTYSGAPSLQPSLAPTFDTQATSNRSSAQPSARTSQQQYLSPQTHSEKSGSRNMPYSSAQAATSSATLNPSDPKQQDIKSWSGTLERMQDERLDKQRYVMSNNKTDEVSKLALGAKVERALARRMTGQDATFKPKRRLDSEKQSLEVEAN